MGTYYDIVFEGKIIPGKDPLEVRKALASVLKKDAGTVETLFSGRPFTLRKQVAGETAEKFKSKFESAGAICVLKPVAGAVEPPAGRRPLRSRRPPRRKAFRRPGTFFSPTSRTSPA